MACIDTTFKFVTLLFCADVVVFARGIFFQDDTACQRVAELFSACIVVITIFDDALAKSVDALVTFGASVVIRTRALEEVVDASNIRLTEIDCAAV